MLDTLLASLLIAFSPMKLADTRNYCEVSWLCSHNAMSNKEKNWLFPNQLWSIETQLQRGIHAQMWDIWEEDSKAYLRHGNGVVFDPGKRSLDSALQAVTQYLKKHPRAVITLILESHSSERSILDALRSSGAAHYLYRPSTHCGWPSLGALRRADTRLIIFIDKPSKELFPLWEHAVETDWVNRHPERMNNKLRRGKKQSPLFIVNHFVSNPLPSLSAAQQLNRLDALRARAKEIRALYQRPVNFWTLDFIGCTGEASTFIQRENAQPTPRFR